MKKLATLLLAAGLVLGAVTNASAIDFKVKGEWIVSFDYGQNGRFTGGGNAPTGYNGSEDEFEARQRFRISLDAVASESLSGQLFFEIGSQTWGKGIDTGVRNGDSGSALGADSPNAIKLRRAYIDWVVPQTDLKIRMGIQGLSLPSFTTQSMIFFDDVAAVTANYKFNDNVSLTALWARPYNDNYTMTPDLRHSDRDNYMDNVDAFALLLPLSFDGVKVTPWGMYAALGPNWSGGNASNATSYGRTMGGMLPAYGPLHKNGTRATNERKLTSYGDAWWAGLTGDITYFDPFRIAWDFNYGSVAWQDDGRLNRQGWLASLLFEYKLDWGIPGLYGWYGSGDDNNPANGSERMPSVTTGNANNGFSDFAMNGAPWNHTREGVLSDNMTGTWGIGARLKDVTFVEDLKHTLYLNYMGGTNSRSMAKKIGRANSAATTWGPYAARGNGHDPLYMTTGDSALEIGLRNVYQMYENFQVYFEGAYIATWLDHSDSVWGRSLMNGKSDQERDPWNINLSFVYSF